jgi:hypothetical protein
VGRVIFILKEDNNHHTRVEGIRAEMSYGVILTNRKGSKKSKKTIMYRR